MHVVSKFVRPVEVRLAKTTAVAAIWWRIPAAVPSTVRLEREILATDRTYVFHWVWCRKTQVRTIIRQTGAGSATQRCDRPLMSRGGAAGIVAGARRARGCGRGLFVTKPGSTNLHQRRLPICNDCRLDLLLYMLFVLFHLIPSWKSVRRLAVVSSTKSTSLKSLGRTIGIEEPVSLCRDSKRRGDSSIDSAFIHASHDCGLR